MGAEQLPDDGQPITTAHLQAIHARLDKGSDRMDRMQTELNANTEITREVRDLMNAARVGFKVLGGLGTAAKWIAAIASAAAAVWGLIYAATHGGQMPK